MLKYLNRFRDNIYVNSSKFDTIQLLNHGRVPQHLRCPRRIQPARNMPAKSETPSIVQNDKEYGFCHHCKQVKATELLVTCSYDSSVVGDQTPVSNVISDITAYNRKFIPPHHLSFIVELTNLSSLGHLAQTLISRHRFPRESFNAFLDSKMLKLIRDSLAEAHPTKDFSEFPARSPKYVCQR